MLSPLIKTDNQSMDLYQQRLKSLLDPVFSNLLLQGNLLTKIALITGNNTINHRLGRNQIGWMITDLDASATFYRTQPLNNLTLTLNASAPCNVSLWVF